MLCCAVVSRSVVSDSGDPMDCSVPHSSVHGILQAGILESVALPSPGDLPNPGIEPGSPAIQVNSLPTEPPGKKTNQLQQMVFITNILKSKREDKWLGAEQVHFCMWLPQSTNNIHCAFLMQLIVFCQLKYLRQMSSTDKHNTLQHYVWKTRQ